MLTKCPRCERKWAGLAQAHCPSCHAHFGSVRGFDQHRSTGHCADPATVVDGNCRRWFKAVENGLGTTWTRDDPRPHPRSAPAAGIAISDEGEDAA